VAWAVAALLSALLVVAPAAWQYGNTGTGTLQGGSAGRQVTAVEIVGGDANVTVTPRADQEVGYRAELTWSLRRPVIEESRLGSNLRLTPRCPAADTVLAGGVGCSVRLGVTVPLGVPVRVSSGSGRVVVSGLGGTVDADVGSGELVLSALRGPVRAHVASGSLRATGLTSAEAELRGGAGRAVVSFVTPPDRVAAGVGSGRLIVVVPAATRFRADCTATIGRCDLPPGLGDPAAPRSIDVDVAAGRALVGYPGLLPDAP
jgi:hypothetical protein